MHDTLIVRAQISLYGATETSVGPLKLEFNGWLKSTWKRKKFRCVESASPTK